MRPNSLADLAAVLRFHVRVGARIAMIVLAPVLVGAVAGGMLLGVDFLNSFARMLYGQASSGGAAVLIALAAIGVAGTAAARICRGLDGWLRHLPVDGRTHRRAATLAVAVAQTPLLLLFLLLSLVATQASTASVVDVLALPVTALGAAMFSVPSARGWLVKLLALAGAILAGSAGWWALLGGAVLLVVADGVAGEMEPSPPGPLSRLPAPLPGRGGELELDGGDRSQSHPEGSPATRRTWVGSATTPPPGGMETAQAPGPGPRWLDAALFSARLSWRALGSRLASAYFSGLLPVACGWAFVAHNQLAPRHVALGAVLGGGVGVVLLFSQLGETLAARRPAWPWSRSLPWGAPARVMADAAFLALHALPLLLLAMAIHPMALALFALTPLLAVRAAGAIRRAPERRTGASGEILMEGLPAAAATALLPWVALPLLALTPFAVRWAAERERRQKVSRWLELHHLAVGDSQSWSA